MFEALECFDANHIRAFDVSLKISWNSVGSEYIDEIDNWRADLVTRSLMNSVSFGPVGRDCSPDRDIRILVKRDAFLTGIDHFLWDDCSGDDGQLSGLKLFAESFLAFCKQIRVCLKRYDVESLFQVEIGVFTFVRTSIKDEGLFFSVSNRIVISGLSSFQAQASDSF